MAAATAMISTAAATSGMGGLRALMALHKIDAYQGTHYRQCNQDKPVAFMAPCHCIKVADHDKQHRQREVRVVHRPLFGSHAMRGIWRPPLLFGRNKIPLTGHNNEENVVNHDCAQHGTKM